MEEKTLSQQLKWNHNPYTQGVLKSTLLGENEEYKIISSPLGEGKPPGIARVRTVDNDKYVKIYTGFITQWFDLTQAAQKILAYIITILPINKDVIHLPLDMLSAATGYTSESSMYIALNELINKRIIARSKETYFYFINPNFLFNGNRIVFADAIQRNPQAIHERMVILDDLATKDSLAGVRLNVADEVPGLSNPLLDKIADMG
jgi:hypothetical protein